MWMLLLYVGLAGGVGGLVNSLLSDNGFALPKQEKVDAIAFYRPGWIGNVLLGAIAAAASWGLYGPLAAYYIAGTVQAMKLNSLPENIGLALSSLVGAVLIGIGGARWLRTRSTRPFLGRLRVKPRAPSRRLGLRADCSGITYSGAEHCQEPQVGVGPLRSALHRLAA